MDNATQLAAPNARPQTQTTTRARESWLIAALLFCFALVPRAVQGRFITVDEAFHWFNRCAKFLDALRVGDFAGTYLIGHPGVTTMWLGAAGITLHETLVSAGLVAPGDAETQRWLTRLPIAIVTALCVALGYLLLRRLLERRIALLGALFWAADPFLIAHSQLLHLDALLTSFITIALLAAMNAVPFASADPNTSRNHWGALALSGVFTGLAFLTKSPSIILIPMVSLIFIASALSRRGVGEWGSGGVGEWGSGGDTEARRPGDRETGRPGDRETGRPRDTETKSITPTPLPPYPPTPLLLTTWATIAAATWFALWPALWVDLPRVVGRIIHQAQSEGGSPHGWGNFFLGQTVADPGPLFYPVAIALRMTPWALVGLLALSAFYLRFTIYDLRLEKARSIQNLKSKIQNRLIQNPLLFLAIYVVAFIIMLTLPPKKFDRYMLPIFPTLNILAAAGLMSIYDLRFTIYDLSRHRSKIQNLKSKIILPLAIIALMVNLAWFHPYQIAYYNPLLGGGPVAARTIPIGWGEGYEQVGDYISTQPNGADRPVATWFEPVMRPFVAQPVVALDWIFEPGKVDYAMLYIDQIQRNNVPEAIQLLRERYEPIHTVRIHGIEYAYIYQLPQPVSQPVDATFGEAIQLRGYDLDTSAVRSGGALTLTLHWQALGPIPEDYTLFAHVLDAQSALIGQVDVPPGGDCAPTGAWQPRHYITSVQRIPVPADAPAGEYWIGIGLYTPRDFARLSLRAAPTPAAPNDGPNALLLGPIQLP
jgi:4-amino-4-deoxy-L-arabinose transferase-like glycosyltransferase